MSKIIYTHTDEAPALATRSLLPVIRVFAAAAGVDVETRDISLAGRILAAFPECLDEGQGVPDALAELGALARTPEANIIKLPNISASVPQMEAAIAELREKGYPLPAYEEAEERYGKLKGSAVNPVLREGNSDRRAPKAVKEYAKANPHRMGTWSADSKSHVATMESGDFRHNEKSVTLDAATAADIVLERPDGEKTVLREGLQLEQGEILDASVMSREKLREFLARQVADAKKQGTLFSLHMKATMMKVSDPVIFGHACEVLLADFIGRNKASLKDLDVDFRNGLGDLVAKIGGNADLLAGFEKALSEAPPLAMVDSGKGVTCLHVPSDVIVDASMPAMIRASGQMWNAGGDMQDAKAVIPDSSYAAVYQETIDFCKKNGAFDPATMGSVSNVGLMARKAEEYGSHDKTFEIPAAGTVRVVTKDGETLLVHEAGKGDIWRACQTKNAPVRDWVKLAIARARATGQPAIFWLDRERPHDAALIAKVRACLDDWDTNGLDIRILSPAEATRATLARSKAGQDTISVTGNVLRDYLTDLFPILELGTSAKMLSIVPLMNGGGLFETGAGGSAPKHVRQFLEENHLRWDSLGEFLALAASLEHLAEKSGNLRAKVLARTLDTVCTQYLLNNKAPSRKAGELDNRGTHFYLALYWAQALATQGGDPALKEQFAPLAADLSANEETILAELSAAQGLPVDLGGYYLPDEEKAASAMRPSQTFNGLLAVC